MKDNRERRTDRGQAFTLEGLVGSIIILTAVLFALQSVVITPTTGGSVNPEVRAELRQEASDILVGTARNDTYDLSYQVRYWSSAEQKFAGSVNQRVGYGSERLPKTYGKLLEKTFNQRGRNYNIVLRYRSGNFSKGTNETTLVSQGQPSDNAVTVTYPVTLYDNQTLTEPNASRAELWQYSTDPADVGYYPIPNALDGPVYNIVEVRLTVW
jgi:hypothetical protein